MNFRRIKKSQCSFFLAMLVLTTIQFACTEDRSVEIPADNTLVEVIEVNMDGIEGGLTYPAAIVEKSLHKGLGNPYLLPDYKSPNEQLFSRFQTNEHFDITIDGHQIDQEELLNFNRSDIKAYRVIQSTSSITTTTFNVNLFTHEGYMKYADNWIEQMYNIKNMSEQGALK